jgi:hypothetical protein
MTLKQQLATAFLATLIVCSVGFAPSNAEMPGPKVSSPAASRMSVSASSELPQDQVRDLTYN